MNLNDFIQDAALIEEIRIAALDPEDPPIVWDWKDDVVAEFIAKILALPTDAPACPFPLPAPPLPLTTGVLKHCLLVYVQTLVPGCQLIGETAGLACTGLQCGVAMAYLVDLEHQPWFVAVLAAGPALTGPLAALVMPRPRVSTGACDALPVPGVLWV